ncbi:alpha/beta hydrolase-fold protein [Ekhidna sp.]|uniref:alpha/beta hydrolase-fold protein n=1 Tax=Ekhidna sp. TaxID=2608089 RepID=UPI0032986139
MSSSFRHRAVGKLSGGESQLTLEVWSTTIQKNQTNMNSSLAERLKEVNNNYRGVKIAIMLLAASLMTMHTVFAQEKAEGDPDEPAVTLGQISSLQSKVLGKTVPLSIHLPANYDSSQKTYPVLYMLGSDYRARFAMLASTLDYMGEGQIPEMILIGIDLPEGNRVLLPTWENQDTTIPDGYINFFETELIPHVDKIYRTAPFRMLFGGSNSGFFTVYTLVNNPLLFNGYFASSPSLSNIPSSLQQKIKSGPLQTLTENRFLHIIYSDNEGLTNHVSEFTRVLTDHKPEHLTYTVEELVNQGHVPAMDFTQFLLVLYTDFKPFNPREKLESLDKVTQHFDRLSERYGYEIQTPISFLFDLGFHTIRSKNLIAAEEIFQYSLEVYPEGKESYLGMGLLRRAQGQLDSAKVMFEKALTIDPDYSLAKRWLQRLEQ